MKRWRISLSWVVLWCLALLAALAFPSTNLSWFDGLPFSGVIAFFAFLLILPFVFFSECRQAIEIWLARLHIPPLALWALPVGLFVTKAILLTGGVQSGWEACYRSPAVPVEYFHGAFSIGSCERSYENIWGLESATREESIPAYKTGVTNPVFLNTFRYDYYDWVPGNLLRARMPIQIRWQTANPVAADAGFSLHYVGEGQVRRGDAIYLLPSSYERQATVAIPASGSPEVVTIEYSFDDHSRSGQDPHRWGPAGLLTVDAPSEMAPAPQGWMALGLVADGFGLIAMAVLLGALVWVVRPDWVPLGVAAALAVVAYRLPAAYLIREAGEILVVVGFFLWHALRRRMRPASLFLGIVLCGLLLTRIWSNGWDATSLRSAGNDPLGFESQAYAILANGNLEGGEPIFYAQPFYRYVKFFEHVSFGDGDVLYAGLQTALFLGGIFWLLSTSLGNQSPVWKKFLRIILGCVLLGFGGYFVSQQIRVGLPEYVTWIAIVWAVPMLFLSATPRQLMAGMAIMSVAVITRTDQLPGAIFMLLLAGLLAWRKHRVAVLVGWGITLGILLLPLAHNLWFGHRPVLFTSSAGQATNLIAPPAVWWAAVMGDLASQTIIVTQLRLLFLSSLQPASMYPTLLALALFAMFYLITLIAVVARKRWIHGLLLITPVFYLIPHFFFVVQTYYPRHIVAVYLSMAVLSAVVWRGIDSDQTQNPMR
jgi:hypothetical protein